MQIHATWTSHRGFRESQILGLLLIAGIMCIFASYMYRFTVTDQRYDVSTAITPVATVAEDTYFRENQLAKEIADSLVGRGKFMHQSKEASINCSSILTKYLVSYRHNYFLGTTHLLNDEKTWRR